MEQFLNFLDSIKILIKTFMIRDLFDILIVAFLIYQVIKMIRESRAGQLVKGIVMLSAAYFFAHLLEFKMLTELFKSIFQFSVFALLIVFQPELRRVLEQMGRSKIGNYWSYKGIARNDEKIRQKEIKIVTNAVISSVKEFKSNKIGALIVFERHTRLGEVIDTGTVLRASPTAALISNIFYDKAPLHDGALIIKDNLIYAGGCILPLTKNENLDLSYGTRHRAAVGISEHSDAIAVVVSEETGDISVALEGRIKKYNNIELLKKGLEELLLE